MPCDVGAVCRGPVASAVSRGPVPPTLRDWRRRLCLEVKNKRQLTTTGQSKIRNNGPRILIFFIFNLSGFDLE